MTTAQPQTVGIVGTGEIGWRMGKLLLAAGHTVIGYDCRAEALRRPKDSGFTIADSIAELCRASDIVITCVTDGAGLREVVVGAGGVADTLARGRVLIDTTSAEPWITQELAPILAAKGIHFLDAPVSGGVPAAEAGRLNFMVGGEEAQVEACRPLLQRLGPVVTRVGGISSGHTVKAINMLALAASMLATAELIGIGRRAGIGLETLIASLDGGPGASFCTRVHFPRFVAPGNFASGFTFDLMLKDLSIGIQLADRCNMPLFLQRSAYEIYRAAANTGLKGKDNTRIVEAHAARALPLRQHTGEAGLMRRLEIMAAFCNTVIAAESLCLGAAVGLAGGKVIEVLSASSGDSDALSRQVPEYLRGESSGSVAGLAEVSTAAGEIIGDALATNVPTPLINQAVAIQLAALGHAQPPSYADSRSVVDLIGAWTGQRVALA